MSGIFTHKVDKWDYKKCTRIANRTERDGLGTPYPWKGYIGSHYGTTRYNGGCIWEGTWYQGDCIPFPEIDPAFKIIHIPTWGYRLIKKENENVST